MQSLPSAIETLESMLREQEPNLLRLYLNPHIAQACFCLDRYVRTTWTDPSGRAAGGGEEFQSFLANGLEEALGGAIKLVRYNRGAVDGIRVGLVLDPADRLVGFADWDLPDGHRVEFLPGVRVIGRRAFGEAAERLRSGDFDGVVIDPLVLVAGDDGLLDTHAEAIGELVRRHQPAVVTCVDRESLARLRGGARGVLREVVPDLVVFDESFAGRAVPFGAFTARRSMFAAWNRMGKSTFHSTTFQPNTVSARHFMNVMAATDPEFFRRHADELLAIADNLTRRGEAFRHYYNPSLYRVIRTAGFETADVRAVGSSVVVNGRPVLDFVSGVACSLRGHNPSGYAEALTSPVGGLGSPQAELRDRLQVLTGLGNVLPAVSGGTAVENALKAALVARFPRRHVLALRAGFGGKTLFSLTGTANPSYKERIGPLFAEVHYVDPFAPDAREQIDTLLDKHDYAAVQIELIQSVGGVRRIPEPLVRHLDEGRKRRGYLLIVDEVQTGLYRTGPFSQSQVFGLTPDVMLLGKGTSDMMLPFSLTLYSDEVAESLADRGAGLVETIQGHYGYELGYRTVLNAFRAAEELGLAGRVAEAGSRFEQALRAGLAPLRGVSDVRVFGLLIAIELDARGGPRRWLRKRLGASYLLAMLRHERSPVLAGFCQYEPNTLKFTPPLNVSPEDIDRACETIIDVLGRPFPRVIVAGLASMLRPSPIRKADHEHRDRPAVELASR
ncbi:aminotransferase class III-fold pyridoxal phosphate-dependent enzyme [Singulisphaera acidiphila]|uniref:Ornithine/acetylornithine aminotransferase n=3 Tax=Singulisphaera acidiphila TaxID=466153 RepID=L0DI36_SINAD|nr:aminotransferase class III-fold pyridoxal phosphate-dependent enzyme [Singulisphaera acidiphila]AGA28331.1 ornithine/acetylornithine aminotransferase [Singulisphaera acidiphila DSM 18658]